MHVKHHRDTNDDQTMAAGYDVSGIRFSTPTSLYSVGICAAVVAAVSTSLGGLGMSPVDITAAAAATALYHTTVWNTVHADLHDLPPAVGWDDGFSRQQAPAGFADSTLCRFLVQHHVGHHVINSVGNFNIVFPGVDMLAGTYWYAVDADADGGAPGKF